MFPFEYSMWLGKGHGKNITFSPSHKMKQAARNKGGRTGARDLPPAIAMSSHSHLWSDLQTLMKLPRSHVRQGGYNYSVLQMGDGDTNRLSALPRAYCDSSETAGALGFTAPSHPPWAAFLLPPFPWSHCTAWCPPCILWNTALCHTLSNRMLSQGQTTPGAEDCRGLVWSSPPQGALSSFGKWV